MKMSDPDNWKKKKIHSCFFNTSPIIYDCRVRYRVELQNVSSASVAFKEVSGHTKGNFGLFWETQFAEILLTFKIIWIFS